MPTLHALLAFVVASTVIILIPGPSVLFVVGRSLALGRRAGLLTVLGNELGGIPLVCAVALGVGSLVAESVAIFTVVKVIGAVYLAFLGLQAIRHRHVDATTQAGSAPTSAWAPIRQGFLVGVANPKTCVFFVAVLPQFVDRDRGQVPLQMVLLGLLFLLIALACDSAWAIVSGTARDHLISSPRRIAKMRAAGGAMMISLSGVLLLTGHNSTAKST